jgi:putative flippase GtrA
LTRPGPELRGQALRFLLTGATNTVATYLLYLLLQLVLPYQGAYAISFVAGIAFSYWLNIRFVFRSGHTTARALAFPFVYLVQYLAGALLLAFLVERIGMAQEVAPIVVVVATLPLTFLLSRYVLARR